MKTNNICRLGNVVPAVCLAAGLSSATLSATDLSVPLPGAAEAGQRVSFNAGWRFARFDLQADGSRLPEPEDAAAPGFADGQWRQLDLPHDWGIEGPFHIQLSGSTGKRPWFGTGWYRKTFTVPAADKGRRLFLDLDGAMMDSTVYCNGEKVGGWPYGYNSFRVELTDKVKFGAANLVAVRLDNKTPSSRWYPGGGLYRNTWLVTVDPLHIAHWGVFVTTPQVARDKAAVQVQVTVDNQGAGAADASVGVDIWRLGAKPAKVASAKPVRMPVAGGGNASVTLSTTVTDPALWDLEKPELYCALTAVTSGGRVTDTQRTVFGIRSVALDPDRGLLLNGRQVKIKGVCNHHDLGALGAAINVRALERQLEILKEFGCNSIRTSHNPPAPELLDLCDRMGFLVLDEAFDCWVKPKNKFDYARFFPEWHERDITAQVRRDRNHPCVYMWSAGNEVYEIRDPAIGLPILKDLVDTFHREDPTRPVTVGCNSALVIDNGFYKGMDVLGLNYKPGNYAGFHQKEPKAGIFGSETASCVSSRGEYFFPVSNKKNEGFFNFQVSSYDLYAPPWAMPPDPEFASQEKNTFVLGEYVWTGFDYLGEPTPFNSDMTNLLNFQDEASRKTAEAELTSLGKIKSPSRSSYFGIVDLCGFKKDRFFLYQAHWRPELPMAHILPHWNWPDRAGQVTPVHVYTSGDEAELFLNGKSLGRKQKGPYEYRLRWDDVIYAPGELKVVAYKGGKKWAEDTVKTTGPAAGLTLAADRPAIAADGKDLSFVTVTVVDQQGLMVPRTKNPLTFTVSGPGEIVAVDNGDATSLDPFQATQVKAYNGMALVIVRAKAGASGAITLKASSPGLAGAETTIAGKALDETR